MREKEYSEWIGKQGFDALRHANCCKIAFNGGWESRQTEVDELKLQVAEMKSRLNDAYTEGQSAMYAARQSKVDDLQEKLDASEKTRSTLYEENVDLRDKNDELQKRVDELIKKWKSESEYSDSIASEDCVANTLNECIDELEQALKGEQQ